MEQKWKLVGGGGEICECGSKVGEIGQRRTGFEQRLHTADALIDGIKMRAQLEVAALEAAESLADVAFGEERTFSEIETGACRGVGIGAIPWFLLGRVEGGACLDRLFRAGLGWRLWAVWLRAIEVRLYGLRRGRVRSRGRAPGPGFEESNRTRDELRLRGWSRRLRCRRRWWNWPQTRLGAGELLDIFGNFAGSEDGSGIGVRPTSDTGEEAPDLVERLAEFSAVFGSRGSSYGEDHEVEDIGQMKAAALERANDFDEIGAEASILREAKGQIDKILPLTCRKGVEPTDGSDLLDLVVELLHGGVSFGT